MSGCVLRAGGKTFDVDAFLRESPFEPCRVFRRGEPRLLDPTTTLDESGFNLVVSEAGGDHLADQVRDAVAFLRANRPELRRLADQPGFEAAYLDFGCDFPYRRIVGRRHRLPIELIRECSEVGIEIEVSVYAIDRAEDAADGSGGTP